MTKKLTLEQRMEAYRQMVLRKCDVLGIDVRQQGAALRLRAEHIDVMVTDLTLIRAEDLRLVSAPR